MAIPPIPYNLLVFILRVVSPALVLLVTLSIFPTRPQLPQSSSPITSVIVATHIPRRGLILSLLSLSALSFFFDGSAFIIYAVLNKTWPQFTGIEIGALEGVAAYSGLAAVGAWKDIQGIDVWNMKRLKTVVGVALSLDIAQVVLLGLSIRGIPRSHPSSTVYAHKKIFSPGPPSIPSLLHLSFAAFRVLVLAPLWAALVKPRISYSPVAHDDEEAPTDSSLLLSSTEDATASQGLSPLVTDASKYGTFRISRSLAPTASGPTTRSPTPAPTSARIPQPKVRIRLSH